jgi:hypothetical protein
VTAQRKELVHRHGKAGLVAEDVIGGRIAHQQHLDARLVKNLGRVLVVGGEHGEVLTVDLGLVKMMGADPGRRFPGRIRWPGGGTGGGPANGTGGGTAGGTGSGAGRGGR